MDFSADKYIQRMNECTVKKYDLLSKMLELTKIQSESITEDGLEQLENVIDRKQELIDEINKIDEEFNVYFQRLKSQLKIKSLSEISGHNINGVKDLQDSIKNVLETMKAISELEKENSEKGKILLEQLGKEVRKLNQDKKLTSVYSGYNMKQSPSYYIDKKK